jgi:hypothetical protein
VADIDDPGLRSQLGEDTMDDTDELVAMSEVGEEADGR